MGLKIIIYGKGGWPYTTRAREAYPQHTYFDVKADPIKLEDMLELSKGQRQVPVIIEGEQVKIGYNGSWGV